MRLFLISVMLFIISFSTLSCVDYGQINQEKKTIAANNLLPSIPTNITSNQLNQYDMDTIGWQIFTAFNWPAEKKIRGQADPNKMIGEPGAVVWETWKTPNEVFHPDGSRPSPWKTYGSIIPPECLSAKFKKNNIREPVILVNRTMQAAGGSLTDQNKNIVHYFISFNKPVFDLIYLNGYYNIAGQANMTSAVNFPVGSTEMKAAWRILLPSESEAVKQRFFRRKMYIYTPSIEGSLATCRYQEMALIGLHFNVKVDYPDHSSQWLMVTFEQVDNVPPFKTRFKPGVNEGHHLPYSLFDKACYRADPACVYNQSTENGRPQRQSTEVIRISNIDPKAIALNPLWQEKFKKAVTNSPWQYYQMITTQYPADPSQQPMGKPTPATSANTTMETYVPQSSCLGCHYTAKDINTKFFADYSFMLGQACPKPLFPLKNVKVENRSKVCISLPK